MSRPSRAMPAPRARASEPLKIQRGRETRGVVDDMRATRVMSSERYTLSSRCDDGALCRAIRYTRCVKRRQQPDPVFAQPEACGGTVQIPGSSMLTILRRPVCYATATREAAGAECANMMIAHRKRRYARPSISRKFDAHAFHRPVAARVLMPVLLLRFRRMLPYVAAAVIFAMSVDMMFRRA